MVYNLGWLYVQMQKNTEKDRFAPEVYLAVVRVCIMIKRGMIPFRGICPLASKTVKVN